MDSTFLQGKRVARCARTPPQVGQEIFHHNVGDCAAMSVWRLGAPLPALVTVSGVENLPSARPRGVLREVLVKLLELSGVKQIDRSLEIEFTIF